MRSSIHQTITNGGPHLPHRSPHKKKHWHNLTLTKSIGTCWYWLPIGTYIVVLKKTELGICQKSLPGSSTHFRYKKIAARDPDPYSVAPTLKKVTKTHKFGCSSNSTFLPFIILKFSWDVPKFIKNKYHPTIGVPPWNPPQKPYRIHDMPKILPQMIFLHDDPWKMTTLAWKFPRTDQFYVTNLSYSMGWGVEVILMNLFFETSPNSPTPRFTLEASL